MGMKNTLSRRRFLKGLATAAAVRSAGGWFPSRAETTSPHEKLSLFRYSDIKLTGGPLKAQRDRIHAYYLGLDENRLLKGFRQRAGLSAPGEDMGGWYDAGGFCPGHCLGQFVSGLARLAEATGDAATQAKVKRLAEGFAATLGPDDYSYISLKASSDFAAYILDKNMIGLLDAYRFAGVSSAPDTLRRVIRGAVRYLPPQAVEQDHTRKNAPYDESYTLPENFFYAYEVTGVSEYRELGKKYLMNQTYFDPLARGINALPGTHAYSHVNALSSAARAYQILGEAKYFQAIQNAWDMLATTQLFASGGWGPNERFVPPNQGKLGDSLTTTHSHFETPCGAYAHMKLARYLLRFTGQARYGDGLERVLYNTVLGAKDPKGDGHFFYYSDYHPFAQKDYHPDKWPCCAGTLPQAVADYVISSYFHSPDGIYVNLFVPSEVRWKVQDTPVKLIQDTRYPESEATQLRLELSAPTEFTLYVRIPGWLKSPAQIAVNGQAVSVPADPGTFAALRRRWQNRDSVEVTLPFTFRTDRIDEQHPHTVALMRGPLLLVALEPSIKLPRGSVASPEGLKPVPYRPQSFELQATLDKVRFVPFYVVQEETYSTYISEA
jgi:hypothetical protein